MHSPNGKWIALQGEENTVKILNAHTGKPHGIYYEHQYGVYRLINGMIVGITWMGMGDAIQTESSNGSIHLWNAASCAQSQIIRRPTALDHQG